MKMGHVISIFGLVKGHDLTRKVPRNLVSRLISICQLTAGETHGTEEPYEFPAIS